MVDWGQATPHTFNDSFLSTNLEEATVIWGIVSLRGTRRLAVSQIKQYMRFQRARNDLIMLLVDFRKHG